MPQIPGLRSCYAKVGRFIYFGRMLDKIRLHAAGKLPPEYVEKLGDEQFLTLDVSEHLAEQESDASAIVLADAIGLYPNPNKGQLFNINIADVKAEEVYVSILDATGRLVYNNRYTTQGSLNTVVAFTEPLTSGLYMVQFMVDGVVTSKQMIVE